jgi:hypothetical protein
MDGSEGGLTSLWPDKDGYFRSVLEQLRSEHGYRVFADIERLAGRYP